MVPDGRDDSAPLLGRATDVFEFEGRFARSSMVEQVWQTRSPLDKSFISVAASHWEMVVTQQEGVSRLTVLGPETSATTVSIPENAKFTLRESEAYDIGTLHLAYRPAD